jgi:acetyl esterase/lipase
MASQPTLAVPPSGRGRGTADATVNYETVAGGVDFSQVQALPATAADARYSYGDAAEQFAELWRGSRSAAGGQKDPVVVLIHGGCWMNSFGIDHTAAAATALSQEGFAVWNVEYRRTGDDGGGWPGSFHDIQAALERLAQLDDDSLDLTRVVVTGHSAGGHLALLAGHALQRDPLDGLTLRAVVGLAAIVDLAAYAQGTGGCERAAAQFMGGSPSQHPDLYAAANPAAVTLHSGTALIHGTADEIVPADQALGSGLPVEWVDAAGHFDLIHPGTPAWDTVVSALKRECLGD